MCFLHEQVHLVLSHLPYNFLWDSGSSGPGCDKWTTDDMVVMAKYNSLLMKSGSHGNVFCFHVQFSKYI